MQTRQCKKCGENKSIDDFYKNKGRVDGISSECKICSTERSLSHYHKNKNVRPKIGGMKKIITEIKEKRGCYICNESYAFCLDFHHLDPSSKMGPVMNMKIPDEVITEIEKCVLICSNCHRKIHHDIIKVDENQLTILTKEEKERIHLSYQVNNFHSRPGRSQCPDVATLENLIKTKPLCEIAKDFDISMTTLNKWIVNTGAQKLDNAAQYWNQQRVNSQLKRSYPTKEELEKLVWEIPSTKVAEMYGVSGKAIEKWCKRHKIEKPPRGYWT